jgi:hypothetical protein
LRIVQIVLLAFITYTQVFTQANASKINGLSFLPSLQDPITLESIAEIKTSNANWISLVPEITMERSTLIFEDYEMYFNLESEFIKSIKFAKEVGFKVALKPHILLSEIPVNVEDYNTALAIYGPNNLPDVKYDKSRAAEWRGDYTPATEGDWKLWKTQYTKLMLRLSKLAVSHKVDMLCIGSELRQIAILKPEYWRSLIAQVRNIYSGAIIYSANWDEYDKIKFWKDLDYIGIDAYFPVNDDKVPTVNKTIRNWKPIKNQLKQFALSFDRPIIFTEFGYRNVAYAGNRPWEHDQSTDVPQAKVQENLYQAFYQSFWNEYWVEGGFAWRWYADGPVVDDTNFTVQGKPAFKVMREWYGGEGERE